DNSNTRNLSSVNGTVNIGDQVTVDGDASTVNGALRVGNSTVSGDVETVNGSIKLSGSTVERNMKTINGSIKLYAGSRLLGDITIQKTRGRYNWSKALKIELRDGSVVEGDIINEDPDREVEVYLRDGSAVNGKIEGAEVIRD
ncbi:MAG: hypothetical protein AAGM22_24730, partial [Acidobacteriota bacterium]